MPRLRPFHDPDHFSYDRGPSDRPLRWSLVPLLCLLVVITFHLTLGAIIAWRVYQNY